MKTLEKRSSLHRMLEYAHRKETIRCQRLCLIHLIKTIKIKNKKRNCNLGMCRNMYNLRLLIGLNVDSKSFKSGAIIVLELILSISLPAPQAQNCKTNNYMTICLMECYDMILQHFPNYVRNIYNQFVTLPSWYRDSTWIDFHSNVINYRMGRGHEASNLPKFH